MMKATQNTTKAVTSVFWDINTCPVPSGCDPRRVGPCIKRFLENLGYSGPLTIGAFGLQTNIPEDILQAISSTEIVLKHVPDGSNSIVHYVVAWTYRNPPPANIMIISDTTRITSSLGSLLHEMGYNIIQLFPPHEAVFTNIQYLWRSFLLEDQALKGNTCNKTGESADSRRYSVRDYINEYYAGQSFVNLPTNISSQEHARQNMERITPFNGHLPVDSHPENATFMTDRFPRNNLNLPYNDGPQNATIMGEGPRGF